MLARGKPATQVCDRVIVEAFAFLLASTPATAENVRSKMISVSTLTALAKTILIDREGYLPAPTAAALKLRLGQREAHDDPSYTPSLVPDPILQMQRIAQGHNARLMADIISDRD